jgi:hypothetical protein
MKWHRSEIEFRRRLISLLALCLALVFCLQNISPVGAGGYLPVDAASLQSLLNTARQTAISSTLDSDSGVRIDGALLALTGTPGMVYVHHITISSGRQASDMNIQVGLFELGQGADGDFEPMVGDDDGGRFSARPFISSISQTSFQLAAGTSQPVDVTVRLPAILNDDAHYAALLVRCLPANPGISAANSVTVLTSYLIPVVITPATGVFIRSVEIKDASFRVLESGKSVDVNLKVKNSANRHFRVKGLVSFSTSSGAAVGQVDLPLSFNSIIPNRFRGYHVLFSPASILANGKYTALITVMAEDGSLLATREVTFWVGPEPDETDSSHHRRATPRPDSVGSSEKADGVVFHTATPVVLQAPTGISVQAVALPTVTAFTSTPAVPLAAGAAAPPDSVSSDWKLIYWSLPAAGLLYLARLFWQRRRPKLEISG